jgi:hypothetical protein
MNALIRNAKHASKSGLGFATVKTGKDYSIAVSDGKGRVRRLRQSAYPRQDAGNGTSHRL